MTDYVPPEIGELIAAVRAYVDFHRLGTGTASPLGRVCAALEDVDGAYELAPNPLWSVDGATLYSPEESNCTAIFTRPQALLVARVMNAFDESKVVVLLDREDAVYMATLTRETATDVVVRVCEACSGAIGPERAA